MLTLFPAIKAYNKITLKVDDIHTLYVEECGEPAGIPILFVHGGPGAGITTDHRRYFDPEKYRIILFDQRGSGNSTPHACLENNTTSDLISDMEKIRETLQIDKWILFGGSWGSTLSLLYAQKYPERVNAMILRGIFLCREQELVWFYQGGASLIFPDYWQDFIKPIPKNKQSDMMHAYYDILTGNDEIASMSAAKHWAQWEGRCATLDPSPNVVAQFTNTHTATSLAKIEAHYFVNKAFIEDGQILRDADKLKGIPGIIVHGRYDMICPLSNAYELHHKWEGSQLNIVREAGHSASEPSIIDALVHATNEVARMFT